MVRTNKLSKTGMHVCQQAYQVIRDYELQFGEVPEWVDVDLALTQKIKLLDQANALRMRLADHDMVIGEYL